MVVADPCFGLAVVSNCGAFALTVPSGLGTLRGWIGRWPGFHVTEEEVLVPGLYTQSPKCDSLAGSLEDTPHPTEASWDIPSLPHPGGVDWGGFSFSPVPTLSRVPDPHRVLERTVVPGLSLDRRLTPVWGGMVCVRLWGQTERGLAPLELKGWSLGTQNKICSRGATGTCKLLPNSKSLAHLEECLPPHLPGVLFPQSLPWLFRVIWVPASHTSLLCKLELLV